MLYICLRAIDSLKTLFTPFLPFSSQRVHELLGHDGYLAGPLELREVAEEGDSHVVLTGDYASWVGTWAPSELTPGQALREPTPLFRKLDESVVEEELERMRRALRRRVIDTHAHLDACEDPPDVLVSRAREAGVDRILTVGYEDRRVRRPRSSSPTGTKASGRSSASIPTPRAGTTPSRLDELRELPRAPTRRRRRRDRARLLPRLRAA